MKRFLLIALTAGWLAQPAQVDAQLYYNGIPDASEYLNFMSGSGQNGGYGVQVGPYVGQFAAPTEAPASAPFSLYCVDYLHTAQDQMVFAAAINGGDLSTTRLNDATKYRKLAYLASLFDSYAQNATNWGGIHAAMWSIASGVTLSQSGNAAQIALRNQLIAAAVPDAFSADGWYVLSPQATPGGQEFLMRTRVSVPEPAGILLMATGLLMLAMVSRKRIGIEMDA